MIVNSLIMNTFHSPAPSTHQRKVNEEKLKWNSTKTNMNPHQNGYMAMLEKRQNVLQSHLQEKFVGSPGKTTDQAEVMDFLKIESKSLTMRAVKAAFPTVTYDKRRKHYRNIRKSISFEFSNETPDLEGSQNTEILLLQEEISACRNHAKEIMDTIKSNSDVQGSVYLRSVVSM